MSSIWGTKPRALKTTTVALCYSSGKYTCPSWYKSAHAWKVDVALNEASRIITGWLKPTPLDKI